MPNPPPIDQAMIERLGELARLRLPPERQEELRAKLAHLVEAFSALADAELPSGAQPGADDGTRTVSPEELRPDVADEMPSVAEVLANAPQSAADSFVVARVIEP